VPTAVTTDKGTVGPQGPSEHGFRLTAGWVTNVAAIADANTASIGIGMRIAGRLEPRVSFAIVPALVVPELQLDLVHGSTSWFASVGVPILFGNDAEAGPAVFLGTGVRFGIGRGPFGFEVSLSASYATATHGWSAPLWTQLFLLL
jgi:hypothetical protein